MNVLLLLPHVRLDALLGRGDAVERQVRVLEDAAQCVAQCCRVATFNVHPAHVCPIRPLRGQQGCAEVCEGAAVLNVLLYFIVLRRRIICDNEDAVASP